MSSRRLPSFSMAMEAAVMVAGVRSGRVICMRMTLAIKRATMIL